MSLGGELDIIWPLSPSSFLSIGRGSKRTHTCWPWCCVQFFMGRRGGERGQGTAYMPTLQDYPGVFRIWHQSPGLRYGSPYLPDKIIFWAFLCLSLRFSQFNLKTWNFLVHSTVSRAFLHLFSHWQKLFLGSKQWSQILVVCTSCKTSYNVLSHANTNFVGVGERGFGVHWISGGGGGSEKGRFSPDFTSSEVGISGTVTAHSKWLQAVALSLHCV